MAEMMDGNRASVMTNEKNKERARNQMVSKVCQALSLGSSLSF